MEFGAFSLCSKQTVIHCVRSRQDAGRRTSQQSKIFKRSFPGHHEAVTALQEIALRPFHPGPLAARVEAVALRPQNEFNPMAPRPPERLPRGSIRVSAANNNLRAQLV